jgi:hypothetical protein
MKTKDYWEDIDQISIVIQGFAMTHNVMRIG